VTDVIRCDHCPQSRSEEEIVDDWGLAAEMPSGEIGRPEIQPLEVTPQGAWEAGREVVRYGDVERAKQIYEAQGANEYGFRGTCGLASVAGALRMLGLDVTEDDVVQLAVRGRPPLCEISSDLRRAGGTTEGDQVELLRRFGISSHVETFSGPDASSLERLAEAIEDGQAVIANVNGGTLWREELGGERGAAAYRDHFDGGIRNHAIEVVGVARDASTSEIVGFYINDTGTEKAAGAGRFISVATMRDALIGTPGFPADGSIIVTDLSRATPVG
jgi:hypothetical protein